MIETGNFKKFDADLAAINRQRAKAISKCTHKNKEGKATIKTLNDNSVMCLQCKTKFNPNALTKEKVLTIKLAINDMANQIKLLYRVKDDTDRAIVDQIGQFNWNAQNFCEIYETQVIQRVNKGSDRNQFREEGSYGSYGTDGIIGFGNRR